MISGVHNRDIKSPLYYGLLMILDQLYKHACMHVYNYIYIYNCGIFTMTHMHAQIS